jgi:uncharacterized protein YqgC (DUF456 family)
MSPLGNTLALIATFLIMFIGLLGTVLPVLPGTVLILLGALFYAILDGFQSIGWPTLVVLAALNVVATTADIWVGGLGARAGGASGWSILAGLLGGFIGLVFFTLPGAVIGAILGVLISEIVRVKDWRQALKAGGGWAAGWLVSVLVQLGLGLAMVAIFVWQVWQGH